MLVFPLIMPTYIAASFTNGENGSIFYCNHMIFDVYTGV